LIAQVSAVIKDNQRFSRLPTGSCYGGCYYCENKYRYLSKYDI